MKPPPPAATSFVPSADDATDHQALVGATLALVHSTPAMGAHPSAPSWSQPPSSESTESTALSSIRSLEESAVTESLAGASAAPLSRASTGDGLSAKPSATAESATDASITLLSSLPEGMSTGASGGVG